MPQLNDGQKFLISELMDLFPSTGKRFALNPSSSLWKQRDVPNLHWMEKIDDRHPWDVYIHIPFCKSICTFCGCNIKTAQGHEQEGVYIDKVLQEWSFYQKEHPNNTIKNLFIGGGTPNALSEKNISRLLETFNAQNIYIELSPQLFNESQAKALSSFNIKRVTFGIQDFNKKVLDNVNRTQSLSKVHEAIYFSRKYNLGEIATDLIYGLPFQNQQSIKETLRQILEIEPDLIHFYPLAPVPWQEARQRAYGQFELIPQKQKNILYDLGASDLLKNGYKNLGFNVFLSKYTTIKNNSLLDRNICDVASELSTTLIGLGVSSISYSKDMYVRNHKILEKYLFQEHKEKKHFPLGHFRRASEIELEALYKTIFMNGKFKWDGDDFLEFLKHGLLVKNNDQYLVTDIGRHFLPQLYAKIEEAKSSLISSRPY